LGGSNKVASATATKLWAESSLGGAFMGGTYFCSKVLRRIIPPHKRFHLGDMEHRVLPIAIWKAKFHILAKVEHPEDPVGTLKLLLELV
jgi:hypothetical protein